jgi:hypothetical protein
MVTAVQVNKIKLLCVLASEQGLQHVQAEHPDLEVRVARGLYCIPLDKEMLLDMGGGSGSGAHLKRADLTGARRHGERHWLTSTPRLTAIWTG